MERVVGGERMKGTKTLRWFAYAAWRSMEHRPEKQEGVRSADEVISFIPHLLRCLQKALGVRGFVFPLIVEERTYRLQFLLHPPPSGTP